ncbi:MAG: glycoside hydrolase family 2 TIM barrel-domain containing protein [Candidatus Omnitrophota bacterium]
MKNNRLLKEAGIIFACLFFLSGCFFLQEGHSVKRTEDGGYFLSVGGKPFLIKGVTYNPAPIGKGYDYDLFSDENKPWLKDGQLMKEMGINCVRIYSCGKDLEKARSFIREMHDKFGIYTIVGDWLGLWCGGPNYADSDFRKEVKNQVLNMVEALKNEKGILLWVLGNENNYTCSGNVVFWTNKEIEAIDDPAEKVARRAEIYYSFVDDIAGEIKKIDKQHLVALGNGEATLLNVATAVCRNIDILAIIAYRGKVFGTLFDNIRRIYDRPLFLSEFGADSYNSYKDSADDDMQREFLVSQWKGIYKNSVASGNTKGNCLGGVVFEWSDEWWKYNEGYAPGWDVHNKEAGWSNGSYYLDIKAPNNLNMNEEWFGLVAIAQEEENNINKRLPKKAYFALKKLWAQ